jgi:hypothetical protein
MKKRSTPRKPRSVLLSDGEDKRIADVAARLTLSRGRVSSKSAVMREAILEFVTNFEKGNGKGKGKKKCLPKLTRKSKAALKNYKEAMTMLEE